MAFTAEALEAAPATSGNSLEQNQFDLPVREFMAYDPKGTMSVTGSPIERNQPETAQADPEAAPAEPANPEETVTVSREISAIARKEQLYRRREAELRRKEQLLASKLQSAERFEALQKKLQAKDYSAADELGLNYEEFTQHQLKKLEEQDPKEERYRRVETELEKLKRQQDEIVQKEYQANQKLWQAEIATLVATGEDFSTIRELKAEHLVLQHVNDSFNEDGIELTAEQAAKEIEEALIARAERFAGVSKLKARLEAQKPVLGAPPKSSPKTITQSMTTVPKSAAVKPLHLMSEREQWEEARRRYEASRLQR